MFAFSTSVVVPCLSYGLSSASISRTPGVSVKCTAVPERARTSKKSQRSQYIRVLPENLPVAERPPPPPRHNSIPYVGFFAEYFLGLLKDGFHTLRKKYGPIYFSNYFLSPSYYLGSYGATYDILKNDELFISSGALPALQTLFGDYALLFLDGDAHQVARSVLAPAFSPTLFPYYFKKVVERTKETWGKVESTVKKDGRILFDPMFRAHYLSIIIEISTGIEVDSERSSLLCGLFSDCLNAITTLPMLPGFKKGLNARDNMRAILREVIIENIARRRDTIDKLREYGDDVVKLGMKDISSGNVNVLLISIANSCLSTDGSEPLDDKIIDPLLQNMVFLWLAGYTTSAITSTCGVFELEYRQDILSRLVKEQDDIIERVEGKREVTYEQVVSEMPYLDSYLMEILRLFPAVENVTRKTTRDMEILGTFVPKDSSLLLHIPSVHRDENIYVNADKIVPERWLQRSKPPAVLSFGTPGSPHYCIGAGMAKMMMKATFATLLREYTFVLDPKQSRKYRIIPDCVPESEVIVNTFKRRAYE